jgi:hypothetical protein
MVHYETGLCALLYWFANITCFQSNLEAFFAIQKLKLNLIMITFAAAVYHYAIPFFNNPAIFAHRFPLYACLIHNKSNGAATNEWGFIDPCHILFASNCRLSLQN